MHLESCIELYALRKKCFTIIYSFICSTASHKSIWTYGKVFRLSLQHSLAGSFCGIGPDHIHTHEMLWSLSVLFNHHVQPVSVWLFRWATYCRGDCCEEPYSGGLNTQTAGTMVSSSEKIFSGCLVLKNQEVNETLFKWSQISFPTTLCGLMVTRTNPKNNSWRTWGFQSCRSIFFYICFILMSAKHFENVNL